MSFARWASSAGVGLALFVPVAVAWWRPGWVPQAGGITQLVGLAIVASGLIGTRNRFRETSILRELKRLAQGALRWIQKSGSRPKVVEESIKEAAVGSDGVHESVTLDDRVRELADAQRRTSAQVEKLQDRLAQEADRRAKGDRKLRRLLEDLTTAGLRVESVGLAWLWFGLLVSTFPDRVVRLAGWIASVPATLAGPFTG